MTSKLYEREASDFANLMYHKGYRGRFILNGDAGNHSHDSRELRACLETFLRQYDANKPATSLLKLETYAHYVHAGDHIKCTLQAVFDTVKGFRIKQVQIADARSGTERLYKLDSNHQMPGRNSLQGLFPRPKPWENYKRGFRP